MAQSKVGALIMAAGKGSRMKSVLPKVLHNIIDEPILFYILRAVNEAGVKSSAVIAGYLGEMIENYVKLSWPDVEVLWQREQLGTGHAVQVTREWWSKYDHVLVLNGDLPMLTPQTIQYLINEHIDSSSDCTLLSFITYNPGTYGRIIRSKDANKISIVEYKDADVNERNINEVNAGVYVFNVSKLLKIIDNLSNKNAQGEYYLPDVIELMGKYEHEKMKTLALVADEEELQGVNTPYELAELTVKIIRRINVYWMTRGVRMTMPQSVIISPRAELEEDVALAPSVHILGSSRIGKGSKIGAWSSLSNVITGRDVKLVSNVIAENSKFNDGAIAGPFAYIREKTEIGERAFVGKFVEIKKSSVGKDSKVPHLSYIGDAEIGNDSNIGAGTITCNYDGVKKSQTIIGDRAFIGSDTMLVAPVAIGSDAVTGAGSTITKNVPDGALGVARSKQINVDGWAHKKREKGGEH
ncbi:MAG: bifunctional UDP-N-acetylglucosamine diphosphorylase/glucosamine-1-phosphate N-acetyltransferase GlmU [Synergistaceae bacterium]|nr:bifunctional UDP-N-acetylglucosamine diphosphorylase/glucosamine-1-phosphate N-acetyltransferase GlmU [Synergistaceae bacterium]